MRQNKKASLFGTPLNIVMALSIMMVTITMFFWMFGLESEHQKIVIEQASGEIGDNLFLLGLLRSQVTYEGYQMSFSELLSKYQVEYDEKIKTAAIKHVNEIMQSVYGKKVCWTLKMPSSTFKEQSKDCQSLTEVEMIYANTEVPGFNNKIFTVHFETKK
ncbi:hypothetical protein GOV08_05150 [Candidatus Woesearchaeota archaeon]|nr:hypothetical protein [Candidatus Woesearchaeota archaeon]